MWIRVKMKLSGGRKFFLWWNRVKMKLSGGRKIFLGWSRVKKILAACVNYGKGPRPARGGPI